MNSDERRLRGTELCAQLTREVAVIAPEGIGNWERAWVMTGPAVTTFMLALVEWERTGDERIKEPLRAAYLNVISVWRMASDIFQGEIA